MNIHKNARLTPVRREEMALAVISGQLSKAQAGRVYGVSDKIVSRWTARYRTEGRAGMQDHPSRPKVIPTQTTEVLAERIITHRRQRLCVRPHCRTDGRLARHGQPGSETFRACAAERPDPCRAGGALCLKGARWADPPRHQETWAI